MLVKEHSFLLNSIIDPSLINLPGPHVFMDIETTGFSQAASLIYLIGCGYISEGRMYITQWFNDDGKSEPDILNAFLAYLYSRCPSDLSDLSLITFNGERFDLPFLKEHFSYHRISAKELDCVKSTDLYCSLLPFQKAFGLKHGKQKNWEEFAGIHREDIYDGGQLIRLYKKYLTDKEPELLEILLLHNYEDILGMGKIYELTSYPSLLRVKWDITDLLSDEHCPDRLCISCTLPVGLTFPFHIMHEAYEIRGDHHHLTVFLCCEETVLKHYFKDYQNYYYLPEEDYAVHKSIGCYVDRENRQKATAATCYTKKEGIFFSLPPICHRYGLFIDHKAYAEKTLYKIDYSSKKYFIEFEDLFKDYSSTQLFLNQYLKDILKYILISYK